MTQPAAEAVLPTFSVLARFRESAASGEDAVHAVVGRMTAAQEAFHEVEVERQDPDGSWLVVVRFVVLSATSHTAVLAVSKMLLGAGLPPDEVWADRQVT